MKFKFYRPIGLLAFSVALALPLGLMGAEAPATAPATASAPASQASHAPLKPRKDVKGAENFAQVSDELYRSKQPTTEGFANIKKMGVKTVINLRNDTGDEKLLKGLGLDYIRIPCTSGTFTEKDIINFFKVVGDPANQPVLVHCQAGADRTGLMVACYRIVVEGWTVSEALAELPNFHHDKNLKKIDEYIKSFDPGTLKKKIETATAPKLTHIE